MDLTQVIITGKDLTGAAFGSVKAGLLEMKSAVTSVQTQLQALGLLVGVGLLAALGRDTIAAAAALDDLADATGSSVDSLSRLTNIARVSGAEFSVIDAALKKLAVGLTGADEESGKAGKALAALGIQARDPAQALEELARKFATMQDGPEKAAWAVQIFGKAGANLVPILKDIAENAAVAGTVTGEMAREAEKLEKSWRLLAVQGSALKTTLLADLVPQLNEWIDNTRKAREAGLGWFQALNVGTTYSSALSWSIDDLRKKLTDTRAEVERYQGWASIPFFAKTADDVRELTAQLRLLEGQLAKTEQGINADKTDRYLMGQQGAPAGYLGKLPTPPGDKKEKQAVSDYTDEIMRLRQEMLKLASGGESPYPKLAAAVERFVRDMRDGKKVSYEQATELFKVAQATDELAVAEAKLKDAWKAIEADFAQAAKDANELADARYAVAKAVKDENDALELEHATLGLSDIDRRRYIAQMKLSAAVADENTNAVLLLQRQIELLNQAADDRVMVEYQQRWAAAALGIGNSLTDAFIRATESGRDFFKSLASDLQRMFSQLVLRPIVQAVMAPVAGGLTSALGSFGNYGFGGSGLLGSIGGLFGGVGNTSAAGPIVPTFGSSLLGGMSSPLSTLSTLWSDGTAAFGGLTGALGAGLGAALPLVAIGGALASLLGGSKGGPKIGGSAGYGSWYPGETTTQGDATAQAIVAATAASYKALIDSLGGSGTGAFTLGFDTDPQGEAQNRVSAGARVNGQAVYSLRDLDVGRDDASLTAALEVQAKRALLAALRASELPAQIAAVVKTIDVATASAAQVDDLLNFATAMKATLDAIGGSVAEDAAAAWDKAHRSSVQMLGDMGVEVMRLAAEMDGSTSSMQALAAASGEYRAAVVQTLVAIRQISAQVEEMFGATRNSLETFGLSPEALYDRYRKDADAAMDELATATDPESVQKLAERINADINAAFGAIGDDAKALQQGPLLDYLNGVDALVQARLTTLGASISSSTDSPFAAVSDALSKAADLFQKPANTQAGAAAKIDAAADKLTAAVNRFAAQLPLQVEAVVVDHLV